MLFNLKSASVVALFVSSSVGAAIDNNLSRDDNDGYIELLLNATNHYQPHISYSVGSEHPKYNQDLDTGSGLVFVHSSGENGYDYEKSTTGEYINNKFHIGFVGGGPKPGWYVNDEVTLESGINGDLPPVRMELGVANQSTDGIIGICPSAVISQKNQSYVYQLWESGHIAKEAYSIWGIPNEKQFGFIFGGIDHEKYEGNDLKFLNWSKRRTFALDFDSVVINGTKIEADIPVVFDTGSATLHLQKNVSDALTKHLNGTRISNHQVKIGDGKKCSDLHFEPFVLNFSGGDGQSTSVNIRPEALMFWEEDLKACTFCLHETDINLIGPTVFHDAFLAFDNQDKKIAIANRRDTKYKNVHAFV